MNSLGLIEGLGNPSFSVSHTHSISQKCGLLPVKI
jgi:hypothetical protein